MVMVMAMVAVAAAAPAAALLDRTVKFLLTRSAAADKAVRFRCCQLLGGMTTEYSQRLNVPEEEIDRVVDVLLPRLQDKASSGDLSNSGKVATVARNIAHMTDGQIFQHSQIVL